MIDLRHDQSNFDGSRGRVHLHLAHELKEGRCVVVRHYDAVGDLRQDVALLWPSSNGPPPKAAGGQIRSIENDLLDPLQILPQLGCVGYDDLPPSSVCCDNKSWQYVPRRLDKNRFATAPQSLV